MKNLKIRLPLLLVLLIFAVGQVSSEDPNDSKKPATNKINWVSFDEGLKLAKEKNVHVFIDFTTSWCGWCKKMEREAFADPTVIKLLNNDFVPVRVDGDSPKELDIDGYKISERNLTRQFKVTGYPAFWFLRPDGSQLTLLKGYQSTDFMQEALAFVKDYKYDSTRTNTNPPPKPEEDDSNN